MEFDSEDQVLFLLLLLCESKVNSKFGPCTWSLTKVEEVSKKTFFNFEGLRTGYFAVYHNVQNKFQQPQFILQYLVPFVYELT